MLNDVVYYVEPTNDQDASLTSAHYIVAADSLRAPNASCGTGLLEGFSLTQKSWKIFLKSLEIGSGLYRMQRRDEHYIENAQK